MNVEELGKLIVDIQEQKQVSAAMLCKGICTPVVFSKMKNGTVELDFLSLQCLLSRLGMSVNKMEVLFQSRIYEIFMLREKIEEAVRNGQLSQAAEFLEEYRAQEEMEKPIFRQYYHKLHTVICYQRKEDASLAAAELKEALELTLPDISVDRIGEYLLSEEEWEML